MIQSDWIKFAAFLFNIFTIQPSNQLSSTAFGAYSKIFLDENLEYPPYIISEAATRIITMIRIAFNHNDESLISTILTAHILFFPTSSEKWTFWLAHLVELARFPCFCDLIFNMAKKMPYRLSVYIKKMKNRPKSLDDMLFKTLNESSTGQFLIMNHIEKFVDSIF